MDGEKIQIKFVKSNGADAFVNYNISATSSKKHIFPANTSLPNSLAELTANKILEVDEQAV